jgi:hypothetical protein
MPYNLPPEPNALLSILDEADLPGSAIRNLIAGRPGAAGRNAADFLLNIPDAFAPGDWIPKVSRPGDRPDTSDLLGMKPGYGAAATDVIGNTLSNPLTYLPGSALTKPLAALARGAEEIPGVAAAGRFVRKVSNNQRLSPAVNQGVQEAIGKEGAVNKNWDVYLEKELSKFSPEVRKLVSNSIDDIVHENGQYRPLSGKPIQEYSTNASQIADAKARVRLHPEYAGQDAATIDQAIEKYLGGSHGMFGQVGKWKAWDLPTTVHQDTASGNLYTARELADLPEAQAKGLQAVPFDPETMSPSNYLMRLIEGPDLNKNVATKERSLRGGGQLSEFLNTQGGNITRYEQDALRRFAARIPAQGRIAKRQAVGELVAGSDFRSGHRGQVSALVDDPGAQEQFKAALSRGQFSPEEQQVLGDMFKGSRVKLPDMLSSLNRRFKQAAVYGIGIPRIATIVKNRLSTGFQAAGTEGMTAEAVGNQFKNLPADVWSAAVHDGLGLDMPRNELTTKLGTMEQAMAGSGGRVEHAIEALKASDPDLANALQLGVVDSGFVSNEARVDQLARGKLQKFMDFPQRWFQGTEQRARLGLFLDLSKKMDPRKAAAMVKESLYDYTPLSDANRIARMIFPFVQFPFQAIPREGGKLLRHPAYLTGLASVMGQDEDQPIPEYQAKQAHLTGDGSVLSGLGLPAEALGLIPNPSADLHQFGGTVRDVLAQTQPLIRTGLAAGTGRDVYSGDQFGAADRLPFEAQSSDVGRGYRLLESSGLLPELTVPLRQLETLANPQRSLGSKVAQVALGPTTRPVPEGSLGGLLRGELDANPAVRAHQSYSRRDPTTGPNPVDELLAEYQTLQSQGRKRAQTEAQARKDLGTQSSL